MGVLARVNGGADSSGAVPMRRSRLNRADTLHARLDPLPFHLV